MRIKFPKGVCTVQRFVVLVLFSLIVLSAGCGETQSEPKSEARSVSTPEEALIGQWSSPVDTDQERREFISSDGTFLILLGDGSLLKFRWKVKTQNLKERTLILELESDAYSGVVTRNIKFSEDYKTMGDPSKDSKSIYVDSKEKP
ncbi:hypothetical protein OAI33_14985 [Pirellulaceae bacterium]|nr:hypothetical protein [Pirellulaceae bacterium]